MQFDSWPSPCGSVTLTPPFAGSRVPTVGAAGMSSADVSFEFQYDYCHPGESINDCGVFAGDGGGGKRKRDVGDAPTDTIRADVSSWFQPSCPASIWWVGVVRQNVIPIGNIMRCLAPSNCSVC